MDKSRVEDIAIVSLTLGGKPLDRVERLAYRIREVPPRGVACATVTRRYDSPRQHAYGTVEADRDCPFAREIVIKGIDSREALDVQDAGKPARSLAILRLRSGDFDIHSWRLRESTSGGSTECAPPGDFSYRFRVKPGEANYLGRLDLRFEERKAQRIAIENRWQEDSTLLGRKQPWLDAGKVLPLIGAL